MANTAAIVFPKFSASGFEALQAAMATPVGMGTTALPDIAHYVSFIESIGATCVFSVSKYEDAYALTSVAVVPGLSGQYTLDAVMQTLLRVGFDVPVYGSPAAVWVVDMETGASTRYANFNFNSFGSFDGRQLAAGEDGIYLLGGDDDDGDLIQGMIDFGRHDFGTSKLKRVPTAYIGVASNGSLVLKVIANGEEYIYTARDSDETAMIQRVDIGKGIVASYFDFELYGNGATFDLSSIEFASIPSDRRIR
jgi:hypothetical protein